MIQQPELGGGNIDPVKAAYLLTGLKQPKKMKGSVKQTYICIGGNYNTVHAGNQAGFNDETFLPCFFQNVFYRQGRNMVRAVRCTDQQRAFRQRFGHKKDLLPKHARQTILKFLSHSIQGAGMPFDHDLFQGRIVFPEQNGILNGIITQPKPVSVFSRKGKAG